MSDEVASLGFAVDSAPLDTAKQKLADLGTQADKTGQSVDSLNQKASKTGDALGNAATPARDFSTALKDGASASTAYAGPLGAIEAAANRSGISVQAMSQRISEASAVQTASNEATAASTGIFGSLTNALGLTGFAMTDQAGKTKASAAEHVAHSEASKTLRETMHTLAPELDALGVKMSGLTQFTAASRAGIAAFAAAVGATFVIDMAKADDVIQTTSDKLQGLAGIQIGTQLHDSLIDLSTDIGKVAFGLEPAIESVTKLGQQLDANTGSHIFASGLDGIGESAGTVTTAVGTLWEQLRMGGASEDEATKGLNTFFASVQKAGDVTGDALRTLANVAPNAVQALTKSITGGSQSVAQFEAQLDKAPLSINGLITALKGMSASTDQAFQVWKDNPKTVAEAVTSLKNAFEELWTTISEGEDFNKAVIKSITDVISVLKTLPDWLKSNSISDAINAWLNSTSIADFVTKWAKDNLTDPIDNWLSSYSISDTLNKSIISPIQGWLGSTSVADAVGAWAQANLVDPIIKAAQAAQAAIAGITAGGGGNAGGLSAGGNPGNTDPMGNPMGGSGGADDSGAVVAMPAFADGGQLTVTGSGGTDSQVVQFKATPGEVVSVSTPSQAAQSSGGIQGLTTLQGGPVSNLSPDPATLVTVKQITDAINQSTIDISQMVSDGSANIVDALNKLIGGVASTAVNPSTGLPVTSSTSSGTSTSGTTKAAPLVNANPTATGLSGAGGFNTQKDPNAGKQQKPQKLDSGGTDYGSQLGTAVSIGQQSKSKKQNNNKNSSGGGTDYSAAEEQLAVQLFLAGIGEAGGPLMNYDGSSGAYAAPDLSGGTGGLPSWVLPDDQGTYGAASYDSNSGFTPSNPNLGFMPGDLGNFANNTTGFSDNMGLSGLDSLSDSNFSDAPGFKTGGSFVIGGDGGTDTTPVFFRGTKGETVTITPASIASPSNSSSSTPTGVVVPQVGSSAPWASSSTNQSITNKTVNINVQAGIQADSFLRSRAQIARGV